MLPKQIIPNQSPIASEEIKEIVEINLHFLKMKKKWSVFKQSNSFPHMRMKITYSYIISVFYHFLANLYLFSIYDYFIIIFMYKQPSMHCAFQSNSMHLFLTLRNLQLKFNAGKGKEMSWR